MGLAVVIVLAWRFPGVAKKDGVIHSEWSIKWGKVYASWIQYGTMRIDISTLSQEPSLLFS